MIFERIVNDNPTIPTRSLLIVAALLYAAPLGAQTLQQTSCAIPGGSNATTTATTDSNVEATFINPADPCSFLDTTPLNAAQCTTPTAFAIEWQISTLAEASNGEFEIFAVPQDNDCANYAVPSSSDFFYNTTVSNVPAAVSEFPGGADNNGNPLTVQNGLSLDTKAILQAGQCCDAAGATSSACDGVVYNLCVAVIDNGVSPPAVYSAYMQFYVDTVPPPAVTGLTVVGGDGRATITWSADASAVQSYAVKIYNPDGSLNQTITVASSAGLSAAPNNLTNDTAYTVTVSAVDFAGNVGPASAAVAVTPRDQCDAWECYGGKESGGFCFISTAAYGSYDDQVVQIFRDVRDRVLLKFAIGRALTLQYYQHGVAPAGWLAQHPLARRVMAAVLLPIAAAAALVVRSGPVTMLLLCGLMLLLFFALFFLTRRRHGKLVALALFLLLPRIASAQDSGFPGEQDPSLSMPLDHDFSEPPSAMQEKTRPRVGLALKLGTYRPRIDSDPSTHDWYATYFGQSDAAVTGAGRKLLFFGEGDVYILRIFGLLGVSGGVGYWQASSHSIVCTDSAGTPAPCTPATFRGGKPGSDMTNFTLVPITLSVVYKLDVFLERWHVPLVPYVRAGLDCDIWFIQGSGRQAVKPQWMGKSNVQGLGSTFGAHIRPGLAIDLAWVDPMNVIPSLHISTAALTFEWQIDRIDDFGNKHSWDLSDSSFLAGVEITI